MSEKPKKNLLGAVVFCVFVFALPLLTVYFSKSGLDKYKDMRSEMRFLKDSIRIDYDAITLFLDDSISNESLKGSLILSACWNEQCSRPLVDLIDSIKSVQSYFSEEDNRKMMVLLHIPQTFDTFQLALDSCIKSWSVDTAVWKFSNEPYTQQYRFEDDTHCNALVLLDGRVSRKDDSGNYLKGPLLCEYYNLDSNEEKLKLLQNMAVIMPAKQRKSIVFKEDEKYY